MPITRTLTPFQPGRVKFATSPAPSPPLAELVSNPTPAGHIAREPVSLVFDPACRDLCVQEFCKATGLICGTDRAAYPHIRPRCHGKKNPVDSVTAKNVAAQKKATHATTASISIMPRRQSCDNRRQPSRRINKMPADITAAAIQNTTRNECRPEEPCRTQQWVQSKHRDRPQIHTPGGIIYTPPKVQDDWQTGEQPNRPA